MSALLLVLAGPGLLAAVAAPTYAQQAAAVRDYDLPAGPLGATLNRIAREAGLALSVEASAVADRQAAPVKGRLTAPEALRQALAGSALELVGTDAGTYTLRKLPPAVAKPVAAASPAPAAVPGAARPKAPPPAPMPETALPEVRVIGEKLERSEQQTLSSVAVATAEDLRQHADTTLLDVIARTPGVYGGVNSEAFGIRGIPMAGMVESYGTSDVFSITMDEVPQGRRRAVFSTFSTWDLDQVEIFMGPQSTVQGRNALAGAMVMRSKDPSYRSEVAGQLNVGSFGERGVAVVAGGALVPDVVAARVAIDHQTADGYIKNDYLNKDADPRRSTTARAKLRIQPNDDLDLLFTLSHVDSRIGQRWADLENGRPRYWHIEANVDGRTQVEQDALTARLDYRLGNRWTLTGVLVGADERYDDLQDFSSAAESEDDNFFIRSKTRTATQELRAAYAGTVLKGHLGVYHGRSNEHEDAGLPLYGVNRRRDTTISNSALFGEAEWCFLADWQLIGGLRYDREKNSTSQQGDFGEGANHRRFSALLPKLGVGYDFAPGQRAGFTVQRGYRAGGAAFNYSEGRSVPFDPETTTNYEFAYRGSWLDQRLRVKANAYRTLWRDQQVQVWSIPDDGFSSQIVNAGRSRLQGLELAVAAKLDPAWTVYGGYAYNQTRYLDFVKAGTNLAGKPFERAPRYKLNLGAGFRPGDGWSLNAEAVHQSGSVSVYGANGSERRADRFTLVNANLEKKLGQRVTVSLAAKNLFNRQYLINNQDSEAADVGAPRTISLSVKVGL